MIKQEPKKVKDDISRDESDAIQSASLKLSEGSDVSLEDVKKNGMLNRAIAALTENLILGLGKRDRSTGELFITKNVGDYSVTVSYNFFEDPNTILAEIYIR